MNLSHNIVDKLMEIPDIKETDGQKNPTAHLKFFNPLGAGTWYVTEMGATEDSQGKPDVLFFGYVESPLGDDLNEWGYFTLSQIIDTGIIELDNYFEPQPIKNLIT